MRSSAVQSRDRQLCVCVCVCVSVCDTVCVDVVVCLVPFFVATTTTTTAPATTTSTTTPAGEYSSGLQLYSDCGLCLPKQFVSLPLLAVAVVLSHAREKNNTARKLVFSRRTTREISFTDQAVCETRDRRVDDARSVVVGVRGERRLCVELTRES